MHPNGSITRKDAPPRKFPSIMGLILRFSLRSRTRRRIGRLLSVLVIISILISPFANNPISISNPPVVSADDPGSPTPPAPETLTVPEVTDPGLPSLVLDMEVTPKRLLVEDDVTIALTVTNQSPANTASHLEISLPLPEGGFSRDYPDGWTWDDLPYLDPGESISVTATFRLSEMPTGNALLTFPSVTADDLPVPVEKVGGTVVLNSSAPSTTLFTPGTATTLTSSDQSTEVGIPSDATEIATGPLTLTHQLEPNVGSSAPPPITGQKEGFGTFYLNATNQQGQEVHQFAEPLTLTVSYTPEQLWALGTAEQDLTIFWFDESQANGGSWVPLSTDIDPSAHEARAQVSHFSPFALSDGSSPSAAFIPSLQGWQVGLYNGNVSYGYPIDVPAGPGGIRPSLSLSYNSTSSDGLEGMRPLHQSSWVGKGWNLDTGFIALHRLAGDGAIGRYYSLVLQGETIDLVRGAARKSNPSSNRPEDWEWHPTGETFIRARAEYVSDSTSSRGGYASGTALRRHKWQVWTKDGTRYDFEEDAWQGYESCGTTGTAFMEAYKWYLSKVEDTHGNTIKYNYGRKSQQSQNYCQNVHGVIDFSIWPETISWGANADAGITHTYKIDFITTTRSLDTLFDKPSNPIGEAPHETAQLLAIKVSSKPSNTWLPVRQYNLRYQTAAQPADQQTYLLSDFTVEQNNQYKPDYTTTKLTLLGIQQVGSDGTSALPETTFTYGMTRGTGEYPNGDWNRLKTVNNGQGGTITFTYENIGAQLLAQPGFSSTQAKVFINNRRVKTKTTSDGQGNSYTWEYKYKLNNLETASYNSLGLNMNGLGPNSYPNSAKLYFNEKFGSTPNRALAVRKASTEFRGHKYVVEKDPNGNETEHWFYQGDLRTDEGETPCTLAVGQTMTQTQCFNDLRDREALKGLEYKTIVHQGTVTGPKLSEVKHKHTVHFIDYGYTTPQDDRHTGLWRHFGYEHQTINTAWDSGSTPLTKITDYTYETNHGNLAIMEEKYGDGTVLRRTQYDYLTNISASTYIVDRKKYDDAKNGADEWIARTVYVYDNDSTNGPNSVGTKGELTLVRKYLFASPLTTLNVAVDSQDTKYTYDPYGNRTHEKTYSGPGTINGSSYGVPGGYHAERTTITYYDSTFHAFPTEVQQPTVNGVTLKESASYSPTLGVVMVVTDTNGVTTTADYDVFGRLAKLIKPGDTSQLPTVAALYYDGAVPFKYLTVLRETTVITGANRPIMSYYDGLGREIQTKEESQDGTQHIVTQMRYDGLGQVVKRSQPRYVNQTGTDFWAYAPVGSDTEMRWTSTTYDALGRPTLVQAPDTLTTTMQYFVESNRQVVATTDAKFHRARRESDAFGRLSVLKEYSGEGTYSLYSTTQYAYSPLDLLTSVTDTNNVITTISYDSLGRKVEMQDPTMGHWQYEYYIDGSLKKQTDNAGKWIEFVYDPLNRLTQKNYPDNPNNADHVVYRYDEASSTYGKGQQTSMTRFSATEVMTTSWQYDKRGQPITTVYMATQGLRNARTFLSAYDSGGRLKQITYPDGEKVNYTYDAAWRQTSACSEWYNFTCYARLGAYTPLDQPTSWKLGNDLVQTQSYNNVMSRLGQIRVGVSTNLGSLYDRSYTYDNAGNVWTISDNRTNQTQTYLYDHRNRLEDWKITGGTENIHHAYEYDKLGNLKKKGSVYPQNTQLTYNYDPQSGNGGPYALDSTTGTGGSTYSYDLNGNVTGGGGRITTWNTNNQPVTVTSDGVTEAYWYDANGERYKKMRGGVTTYSFGGLWEEDYPSGDMRLLYTFNGQVVAQRSLVDTGFDPNPYGNHDTSTCDVIEGWSCDGSRYQEPLRIDLYDGPYDQGGTFIGSTMANLPREQDVANSCGGYANHGFTYDVPASLRDGQQHTIYAYAIGVDSTGAQNNRNPLLWNSPKAITCALPTTSTATATNTSTATPTSTPTDTSTPTPTSTPTTTNTPAPTSTPTATPAHGLKGVYYDEPDLFGAMMVRYDDTIEFNWGEGSPSQDIDPDSFSVRWTGRVKTLDGQAGTGTYTFQTVSDEAVQLWVNGQLIIDNTDPHKQETDSGTIQLQGGQFYDIRLQYVELEEVAEIQLLWEPPAGGEQLSEGPVVIPKTQLFPPTAPPGNDEEENPNTTNTLIYLHGDHLGSVSFATSQTQGVISSQEFDPWGKIRSGSLTQTKLNYAGQTLDGTGLLYYHSRYYDPGLARFKSADSIVPGGASGTTVDYHERGGPATFFGSGAANTQSLARYSYVMNNPVNSIDPTGHEACLIPEGCLNEDSTLASLIPIANFSSLAGIWTGDLSGPPSAGNVTICDFEIGAETIGGVITILGAAICSNPMALMAIEVYGSESGVTFPFPGALPVPYFEPFALGPFACGLIAPLKRCGVDHKTLVFAGPYASAVDPFRKIRTLWVHAIMYGYDFYGKDGIVPGEKVMVYRP